MRLVILQNGFYLYERCFVQVIPGAGHHVYADKPGIFNEIVNEACRLTDEDKLTIAQNASYDSTEQKQISSPSPEVTNDSDSKPLPITE